MHYRPQKPPTPNLGGVQSPARPSTGLTSTPHKFQPRPQTVLPGSTAVEQLRAALHVVTMQEAVTEVIQHLVLNQSFGSPMTVLESEYNRQISESMNLKSALYTSTAGKEADKQDKKKATGAAAPHLGHALSRDDFQQQYLALHSAYTKQCMELVAKDERIARLCDKVTELSQTVHTLKKTLVESSDPGAGPGGDLLTESHTEEVTTIDLSPAATIAHLQELNVMLVQRVDTLEHNMSLGWVYCEPELLQELNRRQEEIDRLIGLSEDLSSAYLTIRATQDEAKQRAEQLEADLALSTRRRDQLEKEVLALRIALERSKVEVM